MHTYNVWILSCMQKFSKHKPAKKMRRRTNGGGERKRHQEFSTCTTYFIAVAVAAVIAATVDITLYYAHSLTDWLTRTVSQLITHIITHQLCMRYLLYNIFVCNEWNGYRLNDIVCILPLSPLPPPLLLLLLRGVNVMLNGNIFADELFCSAFCLAPKTKARKRRSCKCGCIKCVGIHTYAIFATNWDTECNVSARMKCEIKHFDRR